MLREYSKAHPEIDFDDVFDEIHEIEGIGFLLELLGTKDKLTTEKNIDKIDTEKPIDFLTPREQLFYRNGVLGDDVYDILADINTRYNNTKTQASKDEINRMLVWFRDNNYQYQDLTKEANDELWKNGLYMRFLKNMMSTPNIDVMNPVREVKFRTLDMVNTGWKWYNLVDNYGKWDYKERDDT